MPRVPTYGAPKVSPNALPSARRSTDVSPTAFGANVALEQAREGERSAERWQTGVRIGMQGAQIAGQIVEEQRRRADEIALLGAQNQLDGFEKTTLYGDGQTPGALSRRGADAMGLPNEVLDAFDKRAGELSGGLKTDRQRAAFESVKLRYRQNLHGDILRHVEREINTLEENELKSTLVNAKDQAGKHPLDLRRVGEEMQRGVSAIESSATRHGVGPEQRKAEVAEFRSDVHIEVLGAMLAGDKPKAAALYFEEVRDQINGEKLAKIEEAIQAGGRKAEAQKLTLEILGAGGTLTEQRAKARTIEDPDVQDDVMQRLEHEDAVARKQDLEDSEKALGNAYQVVDYWKGDVSKVPVTLMERLSPAARVSLNSYARQVSQGTPIQTDPGTWVMLMDEAAKSPAKFVKRNLLEFRDRLDDVEFKEMTRLQFSIRTADVKGAQKPLDEFLSRKELIDSTLQLYGIDPSPGAKATKAQLDQVAQIHQLVAVGVRNIEAGQKSKATNDQIQGVIDKIMTTKAKGAPEFNIWNIIPGGQPLYTPKEKTALELKIGDVPADHRKAIEDQLKARLLPVSDEIILQMYLIDLAGLSPKKKGGG